MTQNIIIAIIVAVCAFFIIRKFYRQLKGDRSGCGGDCLSCGMQKKRDSEKPGGAAGKDTCKTTPDREKPRQ